MAVIANLPRDIFLAALGLPDDARDTYLDQVCEADAGLRARVGALLAAHRSAGTIDPAAGPGPTFFQSSPVAEALGTLIGPYKLREILGEGGMGTVYVAEQEKPVRRKVALKVIKAGMDTREVIARFEAERQALALMDHPNIAKVLDGGTTGGEPKIEGGESRIEKDSAGTRSSIFDPLSSSSGRPYFVMELVRGIPITDYCDQQHVPLRQRLELFVKVCQAIQHAHQKGVIHRDIKPSNVLVTLHDGVAVPKVIDFGVAKAMNQRLSEHRVYTRHAQMVGSPLYMSPEQAELSGLDVDTRSDVYSLGVLLYELLTGTTPFDKETFSKAGFDEMRRIIREEEPARPSQRVSTLAAEKASTIVQRQRVDRRRLASLLHGELDWIVMKALEKDRTRRYESASAFAADVTRYLSDEPVEACPPSALYRLRKLARRRRGLLTTAALLAGAVIAGTAVSVWQAVEATRAKELAETSLQSETQSRREAEAQRQRAEIERQRANQQRQLAEMNLRRAVDAVDTMLTRAADEKLASVPGVEPVRKQLLNDALRFYERFLEQRDDDPELRFAVAQAWCRIGLIQGRMGYPFEGLPALQDAVRIGEELSGEYPDDPRYLTLLANAYKSIGGTYHLPQNISLSEEPFYRGLAACLRLQRMFPDNLEYRLMAAECQQNLADCYHRTGRTAEGIALAREALATQRELLSNAPEKLRERVVWVYNMTQLADMVSRSNPEEAESLWAEGQALAEELVGTEHADYAPTTVGDDPEMALVSILLTRADQHRSRDDVAEAENLYRRAITVLRPLVAARPNLRYHRLILTLCRGWLADILAEGAQDDEAEALYRENYRTTNDFAEEESANAGPFANVGFPGHADNLISFLHRRGKHEQAAAIRSEHVRMLNRLIERRPDRSELRRFLAAELQKSEGTETGADARPDSVPEPDNQIQPGVSSATADSNPG